MSSSADSRRAQSTSPLVADFNRLELAGGRANALRCFTKPYGRHRAANEFVKHRLPNAISTLERCALRPGNVLIAEGREYVPKPSRCARYQKWAERIAGIEYAIRLPQSLQCFYRSFRGLTTFGVMTLIGEEPAAG